LTRIPYLEPHMILDQLFCIRNCACRMEEKQK